MHESALEETAETIRHERQQKINQVVQIVWQETRNYLRIPGSSQTLLDAGPMMIAIASVYVMNKILYKFNS
jgi:hypothetical protein